MLVKENITVRVVKAESTFARNPVGHTCGCVLDVPDSYMEVTELREEFNGILKSNIWVMDIV